MTDAYKEWIYHEIFNVINERCEEAQRESAEDKDDDFKSGRALAYWKMNEIIKDRLEML